MYKMVKEQDLVVLNLFGKEYKVSRQARMVFYAYLTSFIAAVVVAMLSGKQMWISSLATIIVTSIMLALGTYATNCMVVGDCNTYAWVIVGFAIANAVIYGVGALFVIYVKLTSYNKPRTSVKPKRSTRS